MKKPIYSKLGEILGTPYEWQSHIDNIFRIFDKNIRTYTPKNILDIGCGDGDRTLRIAKYYNVSMNNIYGLDYNDNSIIRCNNMFNASRINLETDDIPHEDNTFDLVICNQVLEHLKNYKKTIYEAIRVTKIGGYIIIGIPNLAHLINRIYLMIGLQPMCIRLDGPHVRSFTHKDFIQLLTLLESVKLIDCRGSIMYPLPLSIAKLVSDLFVGLSGFVCYLLQKSQ